MPTLQRTLTSSEKMCGIYSLIYLPSGRSKLKLRSLSQNPKESRALAGLKTRQWELHIRSKGHCTAVREDTKGYTGCLDVLVTLEHILGICYWLFGRCVCSACRDLQETLAKPTGNRRKSKCGLACLFPPMVKLYFWY